LTQCQMDPAVDLTRGSK